MRQREAKEPWEPEEGTQLSMGSGQPVWKRQYEQGRKEVSRLGMHAFEQLKGYMRRDVHK